MHELTSATDDALRDLGSAVQSLLRSLGPPTLQWHDQYPYWRFAARDQWPIIAVKAARVVSGLHAMRVLALAGYTQEAAVINRTVDDFLLDVAALFEPQDNDEARAARQRMIDEFYGEPLPHPDFFAELIKGSARAGRKRVSAAAARTVSPAEPSGVADKVRAVSAVLDGYVHGAYAQSMELYDPARHIFKLKGNCGERLVSSLNEQIAIQVERALSLVTVAVHDRGLAGVAAVLLARKDAYDASPDYASI
jgi:hypothetical protein